MPDPNAPKLAREDAVPRFGRRMIVRCDRPGCDHAVLMDPRPLFGPQRAWPTEGRSSRFRCRCGHREAQVAYTRNASQEDGPISPGAIGLWF